MNVKYIIKNKTTLQLEEDGHVGDTIDLTENIKIDETNLRSIIDEANIKYNDKKIADAIKEEKERNKKENENEINTLKVQLEAKYAKELTELHNTIKEANNSKSQLIENNKANIENIKLQYENKYKDQIHELESKVKEVENEALKKLEKNENDNKQKIEVLELELKHTKNDLDAEINRKKSLSVKEIGEDLEQFCENRVNKILSYGGFPHAKFEKDNTCIEGEDGKGKKGDYIFKDFDDLGNEFISIMFEMKNEDPDSKNKHKNKDFFDKLDKDRKRKNCRYAVLVTMLEPDNELYNDGIITVNDYEDMYVIRPQFIVPLITFIRNNCKNNILYIQQLNEFKQNHIDVENFNKEMKDFKTAFGKNVELSIRKFDFAIGEIDKAIDQLNKTKDDLTSSKRNLLLANKKVDNLNINSLTKNSPSLKAQFKELEEKNKEEN